MNPYESPQTIDLIDRQGDALARGAWGSPRDFRWFRLGAMVWLFGFVAFIVAVCLEDRGWLLALVPVFLAGTVFLDAIPPYAPGRGWFGVSVLLQIVSPILVLLAIQDVPNPDWDQYHWYQRLGFWGEMLAVACMNIGMIRLAAWCHFWLLRWSAIFAVGFLALSILFEAWIRSQKDLYMEAIAYGIMWFILAIVPAFLSLFVSMVGAALVPNYVGRPYAPPHDPHGLPERMEIPAELSREESP